MLHPYPISIQNPIDGAYNTLSAMTNPTGKKRFEAGKNGSTIIAKLYIKNSIINFLKLYLNLRKKYKINLILTIIRIMEVCLLGVKIAVISNPSIVV